MVSETESSPRRTIGRTGGSMILSALAIVGLGACASSASFSIGGQTLDDAAVELIEGNMATQLGLEWTADCPKVADPEVGSKFTCTATTPSGDVAHFDGEVDREDHINVKTTNVVRADVIPNFEEAAADALGSQIDAEAAVDCGTESVVLDDAEEMTCVASSQGQTSDMIITVTDIASGAFDYRLAE